LVALKEKILTDINQRWKPMVEWAARYGPVPVAAALLIAVWQDWISWQESGHIISAVVAVSVLYLSRPSKAGEKDVGDTTSD
jgi:hypothetical protein